jgi:hypothetical protein
VADKRKIFRVLDANLNRLREALRVIEEYYRFVEGRPAACGKLKALRHAVAGMEVALGRRVLLDNRDTAGDCFAGGSRAGECGRRGLNALLAANFKRGQEACRVVEEYAKVAGGESLSGTAKRARFALYAFEKEMCGGTGEKRA